MPRVRIDRAHRLRFQVSASGDEPIRYRTPTFEKIVEHVIRTADYERIDESAAARYHRNFCTRAGGLADAALYLMLEPYRTLLHALAQHPRKKRPDSWVVPCPDDRHVVHHYNLYQLLQRPEAHPDHDAAQTQGYFRKVADEMPPEAVEFLRKRLLERGFQLECESCGYKGSYAAEVAGQDFRCIRCGHVQIIINNPLWLYKLPEVIYQGLIADMHVPLLALVALKWAVRQSFQWYPDADLTWRSGGKEQRRNIDILCCVDGRLYAGEAKRDDKIEADQFDFYAAFARRAKLDGLVFATALRRWSPGTQKMIENLKGAWPEGLVLSLTHEELYPVPVEQSYG